MSKAIVWKAKHKYVSTKIILEPNIKYKIPEDVDGKEAERIKKDFNKLVDIIDSDNKKNDDGFHYCNIDGCDFKCDTPQGLSSHERNIHGINKDDNENINNYNDNDDDKNDDKNINKDNDENNEEKKENKFKID